MNLDLDPRVSTVQNWVYRQRAKRLGVGLASFAVLVGVVPWPIGYLGRAKLGWRPDLPGAYDAGTALSAYLIGLAAVLVPVSIVIVVAAVLRRRFVWMLAAVLALGVAATSFVSGLDRKPAEYANGMPLGCGSQQTFDVGSPKEVHVLLLDAQDAGCSSMVTWSGTQIVSQDPIGNDFNGLSLDSGSSSPGVGHYVMATVDPVGRDSNAQTGTIMVWSVSQHKVWAAIRPEVPLTMGTDRSVGRSNFFADALGSHIVYATTQSGVGVVQAYDVDKRKIDWTASCPEGTTLLQWVPNSQQEFGTGPSGPVISCIRNGTQLQTWSLDIATGNLGSIVEDRTW
ncbi:hypothetical protein ATK17_3199 [Branchiibius hedensis]|uniref:Uncharacterized protein n=1 Tax=Branchiibius hedensis TaxID=672460 RepID=A0A2Y8ZV56_9MICO|nr:hypothetical protein [Branchiibius hedensis]PWJ27014.1 hypothetical protein ATK17_3199 [Branchiibius hedensis]SSA35825.1 hypothetical protein SAMN04489750_3199 [Branchiibius hedensis]